MSTIYRVPCTIDVEAESPVEAQDLVLDGQVISRSGVNLELTVGPLEAIEVVGEEGT